jgi:hypothetical protein
VKITAVNETLAQVANAASLSASASGRDSIDSAYGSQGLTSNEHTVLHDWVVLTSRTNNWLWRLNDYRVQIAEARG